MYVNDTNVTFVTCDIIGLEIQTNSELKNINLWLRPNKLSLNIVKTDFMVIRSRQKFQILNNKAMNIMVDSVKINQINHSKVLGLNIDRNLS